jgi:hypothetical protein
MVLEMICCLLLLFACVAVMAGEKAGYDSNGRIVSMLSDAGEVEIASSIVAVLPTGKPVPLQVRREDSGAVRQGRNLAWSAAFSLPDGGRGCLKCESEEGAAGLRYSTTVSAESPLELNGIDFRLDLPRPAFVGGTATAEGGPPPVALARARAAGPVLFRGQTPALRFQDSTGNLAFDIRFDQPTAATIVDRWDNAGRSFQVRAAILSGSLAAGQSVTFAAALRLDNHPPAPAPVHLTIDPAKPRFHFDGFGGNYCWNNQSPIAAYTLSHLRIAWARAEMKAQQWDRQRDRPGPEIRSDFETMRQLQQMGAHLVISVWSLPERFYTDPYEKPRSAHFRVINPEKWDELLDLLGSYLLYARREYGIELDLFSFNESNIGINVGLTPESHAQAIKRIGAYFQKLGLKTKMLLGDAGSLRDTYQFVLEAASDPDALPFIGAVGFHSWGGGTPEQYAAWGDVAEWLGLPLLVTEMGVDASAYYTRSYDSYEYGLREARMAQELLSYARPQGAQFWQFTDDYSLARVAGDGTVVPTARFWLMKHFTDLTPPSSDALTTASDQPAVLVTAFRNHRDYTVNILNLGAAREAVIGGLSDASWRVVETTEEAQFQEAPIAHTEAGVVHLRLPSRSLVSLKSLAGKQSGD